MSAATFPSPEQRQDRIRQVTVPLPGSEPYTNTRPLRVPGRYGGTSVADFLRAHFGPDSPVDWAEALEKKRLLRAGIPVGGDHRVKPGECLTHVMPNTVEPSVATDIRVVWEDDELFVVDKPAPLPVHPCGRFNRHTLTYFLGRAFPEMSLRPAHRLDADTSGLLVLAKSKEAARMMAKQLEQGAVDKVYLARVVGIPASDRFACDLPIGRDRRTGGTRRVDDDGLPAQTRFVVLARDGGSNTTLIRAEPGSGRTNQIRIHLSALGYAIAGDSAYGPGASVQDGLCRGMDVLCLHASQICFAHPRTGARVALRAPLPGWARVCESPKNPSVQS